MSPTVSRELAREYVKAWTAAHPGGKVIQRDLNATPAPPIDAEWIGAAYTPPANRTQSQTEKLALSNELIDELEAADEYVIGVAMHNFGPPAVLKLWVDQIVRSERTFSYGDGGVNGLLKGKKATIVVATGGVYTEGTPAAPMNHVEPYLRTILSFIGVQDVKFVTAGGTSKLMSGTVDRPAFLKPAVEQVRAAAA